MYMQPTTLVSKEDYLQETGIDLDVELSAMVSNDLGGSLAPLFIRGIEEWCKEYLQERYAWDGMLKSQHQISKFKKGVIYQIQYVLKNGNIGNDAGYNLANGLIVPRYELNRIAMSSSAMSVFRIGGLANIRRF